MYNLELIDINTQRFKRLLAISGTTYDQIYPQMNYTTPQAVSEAIRNQRINQRHIFGLRDTIGQEKFESALKTLSVIEFGEQKGIFYNKFGYIKLLKELDIILQKERQKSEYIEYLQSKLLEYEDIKIAKGEKRPKYKFKEFDENLGYVDYKTFPFTSKQKHSDDSEKFVKNEIKAKDDNIDNIDNNVEEDLQEIETENEISKENEDQIEGI